jgi:hypothetical protein
MLRSIHLDQGRQMSSALSLADLPVQPGFS